MKRTSTVCILTDERVFAVQLKREGRSCRPVGLASVPCTLPDSLFDSFDPAEIAASVKSACDQLPLPTQEIDLVIPLNWCFVHCLSVETRRSTPTEWMFALEEFLPAPMEELICAFQGVGAERVLGTAVPRAPAIALVRSLEAAGFSVSRITVDVLLAAMHFRQPPAALTIEDVRWCRHVEQDSSGWRFTLSTPRDAGAGKDSSDDDTEATLVFATGQDDNSNANGITRPGAEESASQLADVLAQSSQVLDLSTGPLATHKPVVRATKLAEQCVALAIGVLVVGFIGLAIARHDLDQNLRTIRSAQLELYKRVVAADELPAGAAARLASERKRLEGLTRSDATDVQIASPLAPLVALRAFAESLPAELRIQLTSGQFSERQITLAGRTTTHREAERIAEAATAMADFTVRPPRTTRLDSGGVEFSLIATRNER